MLNDFVFLCFFDELPYLLKRTIQINLIDWRRQKYIFSFNIDLTVKKMGLISKFHKTVLSLFIFLAVPDRNGPTTETASDFAFIRLTARCATYAASVGFSALGGSSLRLFGVKKRYCFQVALCSTFTLQLVSDGIWAGGERRTGWTRCRSWPAKGRFSH